MVIAQSQKVTYIIGGNKNEMQRYFAIAGIVGVIVVAGTILLLANQLKITGDNPPFALPQANLMSTLTSGIMSGQLPWVMIIAGVFMAIVLYFLELTNNDCCYRILLTNSNNFYNISWSINTCTC